MTGRAMRDVDLGPGLWPATAGIAEQPRRNPSRVTSVQARKASYAGGRWSIYLML